MEETESVRLKTKTLEALKKYGKFRDTWDDCINTVLGMVREK